MFMETSLFVTLGTVGSRSSTSWFEVLCAERRKERRDRAFHHVCRFRAAWAEVCNKSWPMQHEANRCTFWISCTGLSRKRHFFCILRNFGCSWLTDMRILFGRALHTGAESTLKMSYLGCFSFLFDMDKCRTRGALGERRPPPSSTH